jgi:hypothetical protein
MPSYTAEPRQLRPLTTASTGETEVNAWNNGPESIGLTKYFPQTFIDHLNNEVLAMEVKSTRRVFPVIPPFGDPDTDPNNVQKFEIVPEGSLKLRRLAGIVAVRLEKKLELEDDDIRDDCRVEYLAMRAANDIGIAGDAVLLFGNSEPLEKELSRLKVKAKNLHEHAGLLHEIPKQRVKSVLDSIAFGIEELLFRGHLDDYVAIVAPDLYVQAVKCTHNSCDAPIICIRAMLGDNGAFTYSCSLPPGTGVLFKPGGGRISVAGPGTPWLEFNGQNGTVNLSVVERLALRITDRTAVVALRDRPAEYGSPK